MIRNKADQVAAAQSTLNLLLREDRLLQEHGLTESKSDPDKVAFPYAAALISAEDGNALNSASTSTKQKADVALQDVERKLALVESLAVKLSRTSPEAVAGHLLRLHGYEIAEQTKSGETEPPIPSATTAIATRSTSTNSTTSTSTSATTTLATVRNRADRLHRQGEVLETIAKRVETSLTKGLKRMQASTVKLERVLLLSSSLKMILRLQFENNKLQNYDLEDLRDLTRAAASVAVVEDLLKAPEMNQVPRIGVVEVMRPQIQATAAAVRQAAAKLLREQNQQVTAVKQLGATLQVYYHLGELPTAVWQAVQTAHDKVEAVSRNLFNGMTLSSLAEQAKKIAKDNRDVRKKLMAGRLEAVEEWAAGVHEAASQVRNLNFVLSRKSDAVTRQLFVDVVAEAALPVEYEKRDDDFNLFDLFWGRFSRTLIGIIDSLMSQEQYRNDVAALYPAVRSVSKDLIVGLQDSVTVSSYDESGASSTTGILGGSTGINDFLLEHSLENPQSAQEFDSWTKTASPDGDTKTSKFSSLANVALASVLQSKEWNILHGSDEYKTGLYSLRKAFLDSVSERLCSPLQYLFSENVVLDDDGVAISSGMSLLPSKYDIQRFDETIRQELALADPREGGGDLTTVVMIAECVAGMISQFCIRARNAILGPTQSYLTETFSMSDALQHDRKVAVIMYTVAKNIRDAADKTFVIPYQPSVSKQLEEAAIMCREALKPAAASIDGVVDASILGPLCQSVNARLSEILSKMHHGVFRSGSDSVDQVGSAFVQDHIGYVFDSITKNVFGKFPPEYSAKAATSIATFTARSYITNASLVRPLDESTRLHITQDLADLELVLDQFISKTEKGKSFSQIDGGKAYAELRAVRQMLFWTGLEHANRSSQEIAKALLREPWCKDLRPSTLLHYLFSYGPSILSSPHHHKQITIEDFVKVLVPLDSSIKGNEEDAWMTVMSCCDQYQQRASSTASGEGSGDDRVPGILLALGPKLLHRHQQ